MQIYQTKNKYKAIYRNLDIIPKKLDEQMRCSDELKVAGQKR